MSKKVVSLTFPEPKIKIETAHHKPKVEYKNLPIVIPKFDKKIEVLTADVLITYGRLLSTNGIFRDLIRVAFPRESYTQIEMLDFQTNYFRDFVELAHVKEVFTAALHAYRTFLEYSTQSEELDIKLYKTKLEVLNPVKEVFTYLVTFDREFQEILSKATEDISLSTGKEFKELVAPAAELLSLVSWLQREFKEIAIVEESLKLSTLFVLSTFREVLNTPIEELNIGVARNILFSDILNTPSEFGMFRKTSYADPSYFEEDYVEDQRVIF